jgi:hypothetical protein
MEGRWPIIIYFFVMGGIGFAAFLIAHYFGGRKEQKKK